MTCHNCRTECKRNGKHRNGLQRYKCQQCSKTFTEPHERTLDDMRISLDRAETIVKMIVEGCSLRTITRLTDTDMETILKVLVRVGERCERIMAERVRNIQVKDVEADEVWQYVGKKQRRVRPEDHWTLGDSYTFVAIERHTKLVLHVTMGKRDQETTDVFIEGVRHATANTHFQMSTDGWIPYKRAITATLADRADYAQLIKIYKNPRDGEQRYSPAQIASVEEVPVMGRPDPARICTSIVERSNLSLRMGLRRFTRLTNAFSKKWENHWAAVVVWYTFYNFCRIHKSLRVTPAMAAGITDRVWGITDLLT